MTVRGRLKRHGNTRATLAGDYPNGTQFTYGILLKSQNAYDGGNGKAYAFQLDSTKKVERFETRDGDEWPGDAGRSPMRARSEITPVSAGTSKGTAYWVAFDVLIEAPGGGGGGVFGQLHKSGADATPSSPIISFELASPTGSTPGQIRFKSSYSYDDVESVVGADITDRTDYVATDPVYGKWQRIVIRHLHPSAGGVDHGSLEVWLNGLKVVDQQDIPLGYLGSGGPYWKRGIYRTNTPQTIIAHYSNWVGPTTTSLLSRVASPLPVPAVRLTPPALTITTTFLSAPGLGVPYTPVVTAAGGAGDRVFTLEGNSPEGIFINPDGTFGGMTNTPGAYTFNVRVTDSTGTAVKSFSFTIPVAFSFNTQSLPIFYVGTTTDVPFVIAGAPGNVTLSTPTGSLPPGFTLDNQLHATPTNPGNFSFPITATAGGVSISQTFNATVVPALAFTQAALANPSVNQAYSAPVTAFGGVAPVNVALTSGAITGLSFDGTTLSGTAVTAGTYPLVFTATDANGATKTITYTLVIPAALTVVNTGLGAVQQGVNFSLQLTANGGSGAKTWAKTGGTSAFAISSGGLVTATTQTAGAYTLSGTVTDSSGTTPFSFSGTVAAAPAQTYDNNWADGIGVVGTANVANWDSWVTNTKSGVLVTLPWDQAFSAVQTAWNTAVTAMKTRNARVDWEVPLAAFSGTGGFTLAAVGAGTYDAAWTAMVDSLIANGRGHDGLVLGPRFNNQTQYVPWGCMDQTAAYITAFNRFASIAKARAGAAFRIVWAPSVGFHAATATPTVMFDPANAYPGDTNVTDIGLMVRAQEWGSSRTKEVAWGTIKDGPSANGLACLSWLYTFAKNHAKAMCFPAWNTSWGPTDGSGYPDADGAWITGQFIDWYNASPDDVLINGGNWEQLTLGILGDDSRPLTEIEFSEAAGFVDRTALRITNSAPQSGTVGGAYSYTYVVEGGTAPYTYGHTGTYPTGTNRSGATVSGTLTAGGSFTSTFTVTDALNQSVSKTYTIQIAASNTNWFAKNFGWYPRAGAQQGQQFLTSVIEPQYGKAVWISNNMPDSGNYGNQTGTLSFHLDQYTGANTRHLVIGLSLLMGGDQASWTFNSLRNNATQLAALRQFRADVISILTARHASNPTQQIVLRDWERNGNWYPNGNYNAGNKADYIWCFQDFYGPIRTACPWVRVEWNTNHGSTATVSAATIKSFYPGNGYVDIIGSDSYNEQGDWSFSAWLGNGTSDWEALDSYNFAVANGKLWAVTETGTGRKNPPNGTINPGDNSTWLQGVFNFCNNTVGARLHHVCYFDISGAGNWETSLVWESSTYATTPPIAKPNCRAVLIAGLAA